MKKTFLNTLFFVFCAASLFSSELPAFRLTGSCTLELKAKNKKPISKNLIYNPPNMLNPVNTDSAVILDKIKITLLPGAAIKIIPGGVMPLYGRIEINSEQNKSENNLESSKPIKIATKLFTGEYRFGCLKIEVTRDSGTYAALDGIGYAWVKDRSRNITELKKDKEVYFPLYDKTRVLDELSPRWQEPPDGLGKLSKLFNKTKVKNLKESAE